MSAPTTEPSGSSLTTIASPKLPNNALSAAFASPAWSFAVNTTSVTGWPSNGSSLWVVTWVSTAALPSTVYEPKTAGPVAGAAGAVAGADAGAAELAPTLAAAALLSALLGAFEQAASSTRPARPMKILRMTDVPAPPGRAANACLARAGAMSMRAAATRK
jgi:hypothetical protein